MKIEYPKIIYHKSGMCTKVKNEEQHNQLKDYFNSTVVDNYSFVHFPAALAMLNEAKEKVKKEKEVQKPTQEFNLDTDYKSLSWHKLRKFGLYLEKEKGVELPLRASRDTIENSIQEVLNGNYQRPDKS